MRPIPHRLFGREGLYFRLKEQRFGNPIVRVPGDVGDSGLWREREVGFCGDESVCECSCFETEMEGHGRRGDGWMAGGSAPQNRGLGLFFVGMITSDRSSIEYGG